MWRELSLGNPIHRLKWSLEQLRIELRKATSLEISDIEEGTHNYYFEHYHMNPHFIFDPEDDSNRLSSSVDNDLVRERWQETPEVIKNMFIRTFSNASSKSNVTTYSPFKWYETLKECFANSNAAGNQ